MDNQNYQHMFSIPIFHFKIDDWIEKKKHLLETWNLIKEDCVEENNMLISYGTEKCPEKLDDIIHNCFKEEIAHFLSHLNYHNYTFLNGWFQRASKCGFHGVHNHGPLGYSSVCFVNYNEYEHTPTTFISPFPDFIMGDTILYQPNNITEGSIIFFPSSIQHFTEPNSSSLERLIVSFNLAIDYRTVSV